jgi:hypothetical protein
VVYFFSSKQYYWLKKIYHLRKGGRMIQYKNDIPANRRSGLVWSISRYIAVVLVAGVAIIGHGQFALAADPPSPVGCNADNSVVNIARSTASAHVGQTITFSVSAGNPASADGCDVTGRTMTLTLPDGSAHAFGPINYPNPTAVAFVGSADYVAATADLVGGNWTANVSWTGTLKDGFDNASNGAKNISVVYVPDSLEVTKTAVPAQTQDYTWTIDKSVTPGTWDLFMGDSGTSEYTIAVTKIPGATTQSVSGTITIHNPALVSAMVTDVVDTIDGPINAPVTCPGGLPQAIPAGGNLVCTYSSDLPNTDTRTNTATVTTTGDVLGGSDTETIDFANVVPTITNGTINVDDSFNAGDNGPLSDSTTYTYQRTFACGTGEGEFSGMNNSIVNTATIVETDQSDNASVTVNCYELHASKTADTTYDRQYNWNVEKSGDATELTLASGESYDIHYTVTASVTGQTDSNWMVNGSITVHNPAPMAATLNSVSDAISGVGAATVDCGVSFPYSLASGADLVCTYSAALPNGSARVNTATATQQNYDYPFQAEPVLAGTTNYTGTADVTFGAPSNLIDEEVTVTDSYAGNLGTVTVAESPKSFNYTRTVMFDGPEFCGDQIVDNTAILTTNDTQTVDTSDWRVLVHINCQIGCTLTQGYWKTHNASFKGGAKADDNWDQITPLKELSGFFTTANSYPVLGPNNISAPFTWFSVFWTAPKGNPYYNLAHQYMAAKLNILNGASTTPAVDSAILYAEDLFDSNSPTTSWSKAQKHAMTTNAGILGSYNEGQIGPGHCDEQIPS